MVKKLPIFWEYFVDVRLKQFRKITNQEIEFIEFYSEKGEKMLNKYIKSINPKSKEFKELVHYF